MYTVICFFFLIDNLCSNEDDIMYLYEENHY